MAFPLTPSTIGDSLRNATAAKSGDVFAPSSDCYNTVIVPALQFSVEVHGKPNAFSVVFEGSADGLFDDTVTLATITQADSAIATIENTYPVYLRARLASISGGINPAITARIRVIPENKAVADAVSSSPGPIQTATVASDSSCVDGRLGKMSGTNMVDAGTAGSPTVPVFAIVSGGGTASVSYATAGRVNLQFDGATTAGHYVGLSTSSAGKATDVGAAIPLSTWIIGQVLSTNGGAGTYAVQLAQGFDPPASGTGDTLPPSPVEGQQYSLIDNSSDANAKLNNNYVWHVDAWQCMAFSHPTLASILAVFSGSTFTRPLWYAYSRQAPDLTSSILVNLYLAHLPGVIGIAGITSANKATISGSVELNDLPDLTGTVTLTAPKITIKGVTAAGLTFSLAFTGANGELVFASPYNTDPSLQVLIDGTGSTIADFDFSAWNPSAFAGDGSSIFQFNNAAVLVNVTPPGPSNWSRLIFQGCALSQASVDAVISAVHVGGEVLIDGGTNASPSVAGLVALNTVAVVSGASWNHVADFAITGVNQGTKTLTIAGNHSANTRLNTAGAILQVQGSTGNDGNYTIVSATLNAGSTDIVVSQALPNATADGTLGN